MGKLVFIFGTRPEFIKIYPVYIEAKEQGFDVVLVNTGQHLEMVNELLALFKVQVDYDLKIMEESQALSTIMANTLLGIEKVLNTETDVDMVLVHGDTSATLGGSLVAFYHQLLIGHIEAGLRTFDKYAPFPEEINRTLTGHVVDYHFAPTKVSESNLKNEGVNENIFVVGNTAIDMLKYTIDSEYEHELLNDDKEVILVTAHRRENLDEFKSIFTALNIIANKYCDNYKIVYPIHLNPIIRKIANEIIDSDNIHIIEPLKTIDFHNIMAKASLILTDSGGIQEEAPSLGKPVLVLRNVTERPEGVEAGTLKVVGTDIDNIVKETSKLIEDQEYYNTVANIKNPYGDGTSAKKIIDIIKNIEF